MRGTAAAISAYLLWAVFPVYFKLVKHIPPFEVVAHRVIWGLLFTFSLVMLQKKGSKLFAALNNTRQLPLSLLTAGLISSNWVIFIYAINGGYVLESSLGYFICPLMSVALGALLFKEKLNFTQWTAISLATGAVVFLTVQYGRFPVYAIALAVTFALYGAFRKKSILDSTTGLTMETLLLSPIAISYAIYLEYKGAANFLHTELKNTLLLFGVGLVTVTPLLLFAFGARSMRLSTAGVLQYIIPTGHFVLAVFVFKEDFSQSHLIAFSLIWVAILLYSRPGSWLRLNR